MLSAYEGDLNAPLLGANVVDVATGEPYHEP
jgi:2',3'-cyclic-nucleotide 2'-phosphodiesterase/3'-nucleotidase